MIFGIRLRLVKALTWTLVVPIPALRLVQIFPRIFYSLALIDVKAE